MFCGIVQRTLMVTDVLHQGEFATLVYDFPAEFAEGLQTGASVAHNGVCLTVRTLEPSGDIVRVTFDAIEQTLKVTNLGHLQAGSAVNIERAARFGDEIGGHVVSGHVARCIRVLDVQQNELNMKVTFERPDELRPYILNKGFVALNGCSLTIAEVTDESFSVYLIPETRDITTFGAVKAGDQINVEIDSSTQAIVDTVRELARSGELSGLS